MRMVRSTIAAGLMVSLILAAHGLAAQPEWGTLKGQVILDGDVPKLKPLVQKGAVNVKDAACCAAQEIPDEKYVVDPATNGFANVVIFLQRRPEKVHPDLEQAPKFEKANDGGKEKNQNADEVMLEQKNCQFVPHFIFARTGQQIRVLNRDPVAHNFHTFPIRNAAANMIVKPKDPDGVVTRLTTVEKAPFKISCDIHPWMTAYCVALDHPYCAITDKTGRYEIPKLPTGTHDFSVWHESTGFIEKKYTVKIAKEINEQEPFTVEIQ